MIVRNEAERLADCLASVSGLVQEMWIVDTGSSDCTVELAKQFGANVLHIAWEEDFASARNISLGRAITEWILVLDADEVLASDGISAVQSAIRSESASEVAGFYFPVCSYLGDEPGEAREISYNIRLFRNKFEHRYEGAVHEQIMPSLLRNSPNQRIAQIPATIFHYGYLTKVINAKQKPTRNLQIINKMLEHSPDDCYLQYHAAVCLYNLGQWNEAANYLKQVLEQGERTNNYVARALKILVIILKQQGQVNTALEMLDKYQSEWPAYTDLQYLRAQLYMCQGDLSQAWHAAIDCLRQGPAPPPFDSYEGVGSYAAATLVGDISLQLGNKETAERAYSKVSLNKAHVKQAALWLSLLAERVGEDAAIIELLRRIPKPYDEILLAEICSKAGFPKRALGFINSSSPAKLLQRGRLLHQAGRLEQALGVLLKINTEDSHWPEAGLWVLYCVLGLSAQAQLEHCTTWGARHEQNKKLVDLVHCLLNKGELNETELEMLVPLLRSCAPHVPEDVLSHAVDFIGKTKPELTSQLTEVLYSRYNLPHLAWKAYSYRPHGLTLPWLEARLHNDLGRPFDAWRCGLRQLKNSSELLPLDYLHAVQITLKLHEKYPYWGVSK